MTIDGLKRQARSRGAIGFDYDVSGHGYLSWWQFRYDWEQGEPMVRLDAEAPTPVITPPVSEAPPPPSLTTRDFQLPLSDASPHIKQWFAFAENIPAILKAERRWCVWQRHADGEKKIPYRVIDGAHWSKAERCRSNSPEQWGSFDEALHCYLTAEGHLGGLSFALGDGYVGFDFDDVLVDGEKMHPQATSWLARLGGYSEVSQSGKGVKTILRGTLDAEFLGTADTGRQFKNVPADGMATEVYHCRRFFFLTGNGSGEPVENQPAIDAVCDELVARKTAKQPRPKPTPRPRPQTPPALQLSDDAILEKIRNSKQADKFESLWSGHIGSYDSPSEADMALTSLLMWWCNNDTAQVERLFEQSALATREKWSRDDYRARTLAKAVRVSETYTPRPRSKRQSDALQLLAEHRARRQQQQGGAA